MALITDIAHYYKFDVDGTIADQVGSNNCSIYGATYNASGKINGMYNFDGINDYLTNGQMTITSAGYSISGWIKHSATSARKRFIEFRDASVTNYCLAWLNLNTSKLRWYISKSGTNTFVDSNVALDNGNWHHFVLVYDGTTCKMYVDNVLQTITATFSWPSNWTTNVLTPGTLGAKGDNYSDNWAGGLDEFGIWHKALSVAEVAELWNSGDGLQYPFGATGVNGQININGTWKAIAANQLNVGGSWKAVSSLQQNIGGTWKNV